MCKDGELFWISNPKSDHDYDGCNDDTEDDDDDNDGLNDIVDRCRKGLSNNLSSSQTDYDSDGCLNLEDDDDDGDGVNDEIDQCERGTLGWTYSKETDNDFDGCLDSDEDEDDDNDGYSDRDELREGTDPLNSNSKPIESFSINIGKLEFSTWDLIGISTSLSFGLFLIYGLITRNSRFDYYRELIEFTENETKRNDIMKRIEILTTVKMLSPKQNIKLEELIHSTINFEKKSLETKVLEVLIPPVDSKGVLGNDGYEWIEFPESSGNHFYRVPGAGSWETWDN